VSGWQYIQVHRCCGAAIVAVEWSLRVIAYTEYSQQNGAVSKVNKKSISQLTRVKRTPSAVKTIQVSRVLPVVRFSCCGAAGPVFKMASQQEKAFCVLRFEVFRSVITVQREFRARF
jgi:hypothetical protein